METWSVDQVCSWLVEKNLGGLVSRFQEEEISGAALLALNDRMVQQLVKKIGHQAVLMDLIEKYKQKSQGLRPPGCPRDAAPGTQAEAAPEVEQCCSTATRGEQVPPFSPAESLDSGQIDHRVLKQRRSMKHVLVRNKALQWSRAYVLPEFPYDVRCALAERKGPDHSMRIRIIEFLQADMTKYLEGSLYPTAQQYNDVVNALLQAHPFLDEDGCGFFSWKRALKDRFKYVRRPIEDDEQVMRNKYKFGHRRGQTRKSLADSRFDEIKTVQIKMLGEFQLLTRTDICKKTRHILESYSENTLPAFSVADNPINTALEKQGNGAQTEACRNIGPSVHALCWKLKTLLTSMFCEFSLYLGKEKLTEVEGSVTALAALMAAFHIFGIEAREDCPKPSTS